ncbi:hypothetical protein GQ55_5G086800 [Panicum hallii var. hallii]|uniref:Uncharacterized protein n=2 Tax=Panicum hallii TaxID=206008 RepID=A0A2T7DE85_9POAL|nr:hypothetical protein GQ55_5G086800 [Panicum hallii var. hallii]
MVVVILTMKSHTDGCDGRVHKAFYSTGLQLNEQKHIIQHEWVNVNFSGEKEHLLEFNHLF